MIVSIFILYDQELNKIEINFVKTNIKNIFKTNHDPVIILSRGVINKNLVPFCIHNNERSLGIL